MTYHMILVRRDVDGREHWRGTGFCQQSGGITYVGYEQTREAREICADYFLQGHHK